MQLNEIRGLAKEAGFVVTYCPVVESTTFEATGGAVSVRIDKELLTFVRLIEQRLTTDRT